MTVFYQQEILSVSGERRIHQEKRDTLPTMKRAIIFIVLFAALGIGLTLALAHLNVWTPDPLSMVP